MNRQIIVLTGWFEFEPGNGVDTYVGTLLAPEGMSREQAFALVHRCFSFDKFTYLAQLDALGFKRLPNEQVQWIDDPYRGEPPPDKKAEWLDAVQSGKTTLSFWSWLNDREVK